MKWTKEHKDLLFSDMPNAQIAELTGRTELSVAKMRYHMTGHYCPASEEMLEAIRKREQKKRETQGIAHLLTTAKLIGAKLLDFG